MTRLCLVYNPFAGAYRPDRLDALASALTAEGFVVTRRATRSPEGPLSDDAELVCINGGDGTLRDTIQALGADAGRLPLCVAPLGTINLVARELGYSRKAKVFARQLRAAWDRGPAEWIAAPLYALGEVPVVSCFSIGPDSHAVSRVSSVLKRRIGRYAYVVALMRQMRHWSRHVMTIIGETATGERFTTEAEAVFVSHGAFYAGSYRLSPAAALKADSVELIALKRSTRLGILAFATGAVLHLPLARLGLAEIRTVRRLSFEGCATPIQVDGDHMPDCGTDLGPTGITLRYVV